MDSSDNKYGDRMFKLIKLNKEMPAGVAPRSPETFDPCGDQYEASTPFGPVRIFVTKQLKPDEVGILVGKKEDPRVAYIIGILNAKK